MSEDLAGLKLVHAPESTAVQGWEQPALPMATVPRPPLERVRGAVRRYRWLIAAVIVLAIGAGFVATRLVRPLYDVHATIWIQAETPMSQKTGPIRSEELLNQQAWVELLKSYRVADAVVRKLELYLKPADQADSLAFANFAIGDRFVPGAYELNVDRSRKRWRLALESGAARDSGAAADSLGRGVGFRWVLPPAVFAGSGERKIRFTVATPRETAIEYINRLQTSLQENGSFLGLTLRDQNPQLAARTMNTWLTEYVSVAAELKKRNVVEYANILSGQLKYAETSLRDAESALEGFRVHTITLPTEAAPVAAGVQETRDPAIKNFFDQRFELDALRHDRETLEKLVSDTASGPTRFEGVLFIPSVTQSPGAEALRTAFHDLYDTQAKLASARQVYTDQYPTVRDLITAVQTFQTKTIPQLVNQLLVQLKDREADFNKRIAGASSDLQSIPTRTIEELRLRRQVAVDEQLYTTLKNRSAEADLAEQTTTPDVSILDSAVAPLAPSKNTAPRIMAMAILGGLGAAIALALLLDALDGRIRYPEQVTNELGLAIAAAIPRFPKSGVNARSPEQVAHLVESFRSLRMHVRHTTDSTIALAVSSPSPGDGKSFVSANLAMSFADAGFRTVLVDGDTRRGMVHEVFGVPMKNGLTEFLSGRADVAGVLQATTHERLAFVSCGARQPHSPELLTSAALPRLVDELKTRYDVVIFDTPPLAAGIDSYAIASALGSLLVVLRVGRTERRMAAAKLTLADRLPINIVGAVLNGVHLHGEFEYYGYASGYGFGTELTPTDGTAVQVV
jgi:capsular exopolysaccharide synthesis family protein